MAKSLGIFVSNPNNLHHVLGVVKAAKAKGSKIKVFFTWTATHCSKEKDFPEICKLADDVSICVDSYAKQGYDITDIPEGLTEKKMATQAQHGIIIEDFDCYLNI